MSTDTALLEKREELKHRLAAGEYKTLVDVLFAGTDRLVRKITRRSKLLPIWLIAVTWMIVLAIVIFLILYLADDLTAPSSMTKALRLDYEWGLLLLLISPSLMNIFGLILINHYIAQIFVLWRDDLIDATESFVSLNQFEDWLEKICNRRRHFLVAVISGLLGSLYIVITMSKYLGFSLGYGIALTSMVVTTVGLSFFYLFFMVIFLSVRLSRYDLKLFAADPASSELLSRLSHVLSLFIYFISVYAAYLTLGVASIGLLPSVGIFPVLFLWGPIIAMFILNQTSLSSIIRRAKWKTLNEIQARVEKLQAMENYSDKETMDAINRLMDYHDRVKRTRNSAIDLGATLNFINSLLLPLLAFLIGNLNLVLSLFKRQP